MCNGKKMNIQPCWHFDEPIKKALPDDGDDDGDALDASSVHKMQLTRIYT